jgi:putative hydrolase of the HAD superfamily
MRDGIEGVAFDLDGTLYPNYRLNVRLLPFILKETRLLSAFGKARNIIRKEQKDSPVKIFKSDDEFYEYQADIVSKLLKESLDPAPPERMREKIERLIYKGWEPFFKRIKLFNNVVKTLSLLKAAGYKLGLLSDFPPETKLEYLGIAGFWDAVLCSERCGALKPHPASFTELAKAMSLPCEKILYVGNSRPYDVVGAEKAGMKTAWVKSPLFPGSGLKKPKPDFTFSNYRQLHDFMIN